MLIFEEIRRELESRNNRTIIQDGFIQRTIVSFEEKVIREALLNAVAHRDYSRKGFSIFIKASPEELVIQNPGGLLPGITLENILKQTAWRNRLLAETLERTGLVERSGQGLDDVFELSIRGGKGTPTLRELDYSSFRIEIPGKIIDKEFVIFLEKVAKEKQAYFTFEEILELEQIRNGEKNKQLEFKDRFLQFGIIEKIGQGRGSLYILSHKFYQSIDKLGKYTRLAGLSREKKKEMILEHMRKNGKAFTREISEAFPELTSKDISNLLQELRRNSLIVHSGTKKSGYWLLKN